jgi:hypothetical protein
VLAVVALNAVWNARNVVKHWPELTLLHHLLGILLWLVLPLLAVLLVWRGRAAGRWILVCLFGLRALAGLSALTLDYDIVVKCHPGAFFAEPLRTWVLDTLFYCGATIWLLASPDIRQVCGKSGSSD